MSTTLLRSADALPSQVGRRWLITGATSGIGREAARAVAAAGGSLVLPVRSLERGEALAATLRDLGGDAEVLRLDLADLASVRACAAALEGHVDVLIDNAGGVSTRKRTTIDGFEQLLGTNFLGPFAFTNLVAERVRDRIVIVGSEAHRAGRLHPDPHFRARRWSMPVAYARSKLYDMLWAVGLQRRLDARGSAVEVRLAHPGWSLTSIQNVTGSAVIDRVIGVLTSPFSQPAAAGALPLLSAAVDAMPPLSYVGPDGPRAWRGLPALQTPAALASDVAAAEAVWSFGVTETGTDLEPDATRARTDTA